MKKELRICSCGRLHFIDSEIIHTALQNDKDVLMICGRCGKATMIGADRMPDYWGGTDKEVFDMYSYHAGDEDFILDAWRFENTNAKKGIYKVIYSVGKGVMMESGSYAREFFYGRFADTWYPDFYHIERKDITVKEIMNFLDKWRHDRVKVNRNYLLRELTDEEAEILSYYAIEGLDWTGTKYERKQS